RIRRPLSRSVCSLMTRRPSSARRGRAGVTLTGLAPWLAGARARRPARPPPRQPWHSPLPFETEKSPLGACAHARHAARAAPSCCTPPPILHRDLNTYASTSPFMIVQQRRRLGRVLSSEEAYEPQRQLRHVGQDHQAHNGNADEWRETSIDAA